MLREIAGVDAVSGRAEVDGYFTLRGQTAREMMQSLSGRVALAASEGAVEGVDVPAISRQIDALSKVDTLDDIASFVDGTEQSLSSGRTAIRSLDGTVRVQDGQARIDGFEIVAEGGVGEISGTADRACVAAGPHGAVPPHRARGCSAGGHTVRGADRPARAPPI